MRNQFEGKVVVILGASAEGGCGWVTAEKFANEGAYVIVGARSWSGIEKLANKINGKAIRCDVSKEEDVVAIGQAAIDMGGVDIAVNAAGIPVPSLISTFNKETFDFAMQVNFYGNLLFLRTMADAMPRGGSIVSLSSMAAITVTPGHLLYSCAKAAGIMAAKHAALEYANRNIRVNVLAPGLIDTPMTKTLIENPDLLNIYMKETPLKRVTTATEIANTIAWLALTESVTGTVVTIDGGIHLRRPPQPEEIPSNSYSAL